MLEQPDDATLLIIASRGDSEGFRQLFHRHYEAIFCFAYRLSGSVSVAEEITQDCFLSLLQHPVRYNASRGSLKTYVYGIARNLFLKQLRRSGLDVNLEDSGAIIRRHEGLDPGSWILDRVWLSFWTNLRKSDRTSCRRLSKNARGGCPKW